MKYGKYEYERIYLLQSNCLRGKRVKGIKKIRDKYIKGTKLRLREVVENNETKYKFTRKERLNPSKVGVLKINTLYLTKSEYDRINVLEGFEVEKERQMLQIDQIRIGVDRIMLNNKNLFIAEVEFDTELEMNSFTMPLQIIKEITGDQKYSGYEIAKEYSKYKCKKKLKKRPT